MLPKYFWYALGEIILVVIGILIAIQINAWYQGVLDRKEEIEILEDIQSEYESNRALLTSIINGRQELADDWADFIRNLTQDRSSARHRFQENLSFGAIRFYPSNGVMNTLIATGSIDLIRNDSLKHSLLNWNESLLGYFEDEALHVDFANNQLIPYEQNLVPTPFRLQEGFEYVFEDEKTIIQQTRRAYEDLKYRNILLRNHFWIQRNLGSAKTLKKRYDDIIGRIGRELQQSE